MIIAQPQRQTLSQALIPQHTLFRQIVAVLVGAAFITLCARASMDLPIGPVPITGLTFGVLLAGALLGPWLGAMAAVTYVAIGIAGLPVYAGGAHGWAVITGSTGGYILAAPIAALLVGWLAGLGWDRRPLTLALALLAGEVVFYALGLPLLYLWGASHEDLIQTTMTWNLTLDWGLWPFIPGDLAKLVLAASLVPAGWHVLHAAKLGPGRVLREDAPTPANLAPLGIAAGIAMIVGSMLPWPPSGDLGISNGVGFVVLATGVAGAAAAWLRSTALIGPAIAQLLGFLSAAVAGLASLVYIVEFSADGAVALAGFEFGAITVALAALAMLAYAITETARDAEA